MIKKLEINLEIKIILLIYAVLNLKYKNYEKRKNI